MNRYDTPMNHYDTLRARARQAIRAGLLPLRRPETVWSDRGTGERCVLCNSSVGLDEIEFDVELASAASLEPDSLRFHSRCWTAWREEVKDSEHSGDLTGRIYRNIMPGYGSGAIGQAPA